MSDWLLTGIPRAGTSLCCRLAGQLPNTVALVEPIESKTFADTEDPLQGCALIARFMSRTRQRIWAEECSTKRTATLGNDPLHDSWVPELGVAPRPLLRRPSLRRRGFDVE